MNEDYTNAAHGVQPCGLSDEDMASIGKIVRGCAEIEDILSLHLCQVADISEGQFLVLLGRATMRSKEVIAGQLAKAKSPAAHAAHKACFGSDAFDKLVGCRNAVAHGVLIGKDSDGRMLFRTATANKASDDVVAVKALKFSSDDLKAFAAIADQLVPQFETHLRTKSLREERLIPPPGS